VARSVGGDVAQRHSTLVKLATTRTAGQRHGSSWQRGMVPSVALIVGTASVMGRRRERRCHCATLVSPPRSKLFCWSRNVAVFARGGDAGTGDQFSELVRLSLEAAFRVAWKLGHLAQGDDGSQQGKVGTDHLLLGMAMTEGSAACRALRSVGVTAGGLEEALFRLRPAVAVGGSSSPSALDALSPPLSAELGFYLRRASTMLSWKAPVGPGSGRMLGTEHIMLGLLSNGTHNAGRLLLEFDSVGFDRTVVQFDSGSGGSASNPRRAALRAAVMRLANEGQGDAETSFAAVASAPRAASQKKNSGAGRQASGPPGSALEAFASDLTSLAEQGALDPFAGRDNVVERVERALGRRRKRSVLLIGDPGVGKTALVEAIAQRIAAGVAPPWLSGRRVHALDVGALTAGTRLRGDFEERLKAVLAEIEDSEAVLFVDEAHTLVGGGSSLSSPLDAADMLKPALARGNLQCIAATTVEEYREHFSKDAALERRFEVVEVDEPTVPETVAILDALRQRYESHHGVVFDAGVLSKAAEWSARHLPERRLPDKAIDVLDRAAVLARSLNLSQRMAVVVKEEHVAAAIEEVVGLKPGAISAAEALQAFQLVPELAQRVRGQPAAVELLASAVARAKAGLQEERRPILSVLLYGPPGVGKTSLAVALAEVCLGSRQALLRLDCASVAGGEAGKVLVNGIRRRPHSVVLIDEVDKASPELLNMLLEVLEEGSLSLASVEGGLGRADFRHAFIVMTSNSPEGPEALPLALSDRLDGSAALTPLGEQSLLEVLDTQVLEVGLRLARGSPGASLEVSEAWRRAAVAQALGAAGPGAAASGVRSLRRVVRQLLEDPLANSLLRRQAEDPSQTASSARWWADVGPGGEPEVNVMEPQVA